MQRRFRVALYGVSTLGLLASRLSLINAESPAPLPLHPLPTAPTAVSSASPAAAPPAFLLVDSDAALEALYAEPRALILVTRGFPAPAASAALAAFAAAVAALGPSAPRAYVIDAASSQVPALTFLETLGLTSADPYAVLTVDFKRTRQKYLMTAAGVPTAQGIAALVQRQAAGELQPALLGQTRPPNDACPTFPALTEVVSSSFGELVLAPRVPVLLLVHRRTCDACKAFAPRYRMFAQLAAQHLPALRVATIDASDNDLDYRHIPESWTPVLRFFPEAGSSGSGSPAGKPSQLLDTRVDGLATKIHLPTLPQLLEFLAANAGSSGSSRLPVTPELLALAGSLEEEAAALEAAYDQLLNYVQLWKAYSEVASGEEALAAAQGLKAKVLTLYNFIVKKAAVGGADVAWDMLEGISQHVEVHGISKAVAKAAQAMQEGLGEK